MSDLLSPLAEVMVRDESVAELYRQLDPADLLYNYMIGFAMGTFGSGANIATGQNAEANAELKTRDASEATYLRRMEEIGYLPSEGSKNAAREGTAEESTAVNTDPAKHTAVEQAVIDEFQAAVDEKLVQYVQTVQEKGLAGQKPYELKPVSERASKDIMQITGVNTKGNSTKIEARIVFHILKDHGENGKTDHSMRDVNDIARIQFVLDNYDNVIDGGRTNAYMTVKPNGKQGLSKTVVFSKAVNGTFYVVEAVPNTKTKTVFIVSAYMQKNKSEGT